MLPAPNNAVYNEGNPVAGVQQSWPRAAVTGRQWEKKKRKKENKKSLAGAERERQPDPMNRQLFLKRQRREGGRWGRRFCLGGPLLF